MEDLKIKFIENNEFGVYMLSTPLHSFSCYVIPRNKIGAAVAYESIESNGVYFLINSVESVFIKRSLYIGVTVQGPRRLSDHKAKKQHWDKAIMFLGPKSVFSSDTINEVERIMIEKYSLSELYKLENKHTSKFEPERIAERFAEQILRYLNFLNYGLTLGVEAKSEYNKEKGEPKIITTPAKYPKMDALFSWGIIKAGDEVMIKGNPDKIAVVIDDKTVSYNNKKMSFNQWGQLVTGWKSIQIYVHCYIVGQTESLHEQRIIKMEELGL